MGRQSSVSQGFGVVGCPVTCTRAHLLPETLERLVSAGIDRTLIADCLEYETTSHGPAHGNQGLTSAGKRNLRAWGAKPGEIEEIEETHGGREPIQLDYYARERARVASYRERTDPDVLRARNRDAAQRYRDRKKSLRDGGRKLPGGEA